MGSEMCIRDSARIGRDLVVAVMRNHEGSGAAGPDLLDIGDHLLCLLYTSDAADERSSVDLGGRRIIKKKITSHTGYRL